MKIFAYPELRVLPLKGKIDLSRLRQGSGVQFQAMQSEATVLSFAIGDMLPAVDSPMDPSWARQGNEQPRPMSNAADRRMLAPNSVLERWSLPTISAPH